MKRQTMALMRAGSLIHIHFGGSLILSVDDKGLFLILIILRRLVLPILVPPFFLLFLIRHQ